jgi:hypothetical protein
MYKLSAIAFYNLFPFWCDAWLTSAYEEYRASAEYERYVSWDMDLAMINYHFVLKRESWMNMALTKHWRRIIFRPWSFVRQKDMFVDFENRVQESE